VAGSVRPANSNTQTRNTRLADEVAALPPDVRPAVSAAIQHGNLPASPAVSATNTGFALIGPFGQSITDTRPEFSWQPLDGAVTYSIAIVDTRLHAVQHSHELKTTGWRPKHPLSPGQTYLWQVTATLKGGTTVVASGPPGSEAMIKIVPQTLATEITRFRKQHEDAHFVLGAMYAQAGMLSESADELKQVAPGDASYALARKMLESLPAAKP
jgi:hypothetical protein